MIVHILSPHPYNCYNKYTKPPVLELICINEVHCLSKPRKAAEHRNFYKSRSKSTWKYTDINHAGEYCALSSVTGKLISHPTSHHPTPWNAAERQNSEYNHPPTPHTLTAERQSTVSYNTHPPTLMMRMVNNNNNNNMPQASCTCAETTMCSSTLLGNMGTLQNS